ncbi:MAG TPA: carbon-nitrogen hydrolase [Geobacteraceae bacterium]|nr:carbon-nitrogen hydrolase [Geobacteraceae bacterium]
MNVIKVALVQQSCGTDKGSNLSKSIARIREAAGKGANIAVLQELHSGPYFCQSEDTGNFDMAETVPGPSTELLGSVARECGIVLVASIFEKRAPGLYHNTAVVFEKDGTIAGTYRKMHIPDDPAYYEKFYFTPGDLGFNPVTTSAGRLGVLVCWDQWYPEAARLMALAGAQVLVYPTAIGWDPMDSEEEKQRQLDAWITIQRSHAVANGIPVVSANRVGFEPAPSTVDNGIQFWGNSFVAGSQGEFLGRACTDREELVIAEIDLRRSEEVRRIWPFLRDRRIDAYHDLVKRYRD